MFKTLVFAAALAVSFSGFAADTPAAAGAPAATPMPAPGADAKSQHARMKALQATCNKRAEAHKLAGEGRKAFVAKCLSGK